MTQHTLGPWRYHLGRGANPRFHVQMPHGYQIASTTEISRITSEATQQEANARLIAASPDLLRACQDALWRLGELEGSDAQHIDGSTQHQLRLAIAAAQGQEAQP